MKKYNVVLVGVGGFGKHFINIYKNHPNVGEIGIFDTNSTVVNECARDYGINKIYNSFEEILSDNTVDAVHLLTPIPIHAEQTIKALEAGKHCACAVPMATSLEDLQRITDAVRKSGKNYMMMETSVYTHHYHYVKNMYESGELGRIQFMRGSHYQNMSGWASYWMGLPPMHYGTHAISPMVALSGSRIKRVHCFGSGTMAEWLSEQYGNPFPIESALFEFENGMKGEATRSLFETARFNQEGFFVYGSKKSFEWGFGEHDKPYVTTLEESEEKNVRTYPTFGQIDLPNYSSLLPKELQEYADGAHHGSHPHLVHEFMMSIVENRKPEINEVIGANITAAGICAHISAMKNGEGVIVPEF